MLTGGGSTATMPSPSTIVTTTTTSTPSTYFDGEPYRFDDLPESVTVSLYVPETFDPKTCNGDRVEIKHHQLMVQVAGEDSPRLKGWLFAPIDEHGSLYEIQPEAKTGLRTLTVHLTKIELSEYEGFPTFPLLFASGYDTPAPLPKTATLEDLDPHSVYLLADFLLRRVRATARAFDMYERAADRGSVKACLKLAAWYHIGSEVEPSVPVKKDATRSFRYHKKAADLGNAEACLHISVCLVPEDEAAAAAAAVGSEEGLEEAVRYCEASRDLCVAHGQSSHEIVRLAMWRAGNLLRLSTKDAAASPEKVRRAFECYDLVASSFDDPLATWTVATYHLWGFGTQQDVKRAVELLRKALARDAGLGMPAGLEGLDDMGLDVFVQVEEEARKLVENDPGKALDVEGLTRSAKEIITLAGGSEHVQATIDAALKELDLGVMKVQNIEEPVESSPATREAKPKTKARRAKRTRTTRLMTPLDAAFVVGVGLAAGLGVWMFLKSRRTHS
ncbi:hypothetical protein HKX48_008245 [Thoreauomyces humboldtii]|nr:hypothetical protein HKX48_008245 [Thoreauomyces humboldtii]